MNLEEIVEQLKLLHKKPESLLETPLAKNILWNLASEIELIIKQGKDTAYVKDPNDNN
jgi:hypothetical protein